MMLFLFFQMSKAVETIKDGKVDWSKGIVTAKGYGVFDINAKNVESAKSSSCCRSKELT